MSGPYGRRAAQQQGVGALLAMLLGAVLLLGTVLLWPGAAAAAPVKLLVFGDSLAAGYGLSRAEGFQALLGAALHRDGFDVTVLDGGVSGDTAAGGRARIDWVLADRPDAAILELGGNDGLRGLPTEQLQANLGAILDRLDQAHVATLLTGMYPPPNLGADYTRAFRAVYTTLARRSGVAFDPFFLQGVALHPELIQADGVHPNAAGERVIVARILPAVEALLRRVQAK